MNARKVKRVAIYTRVSRDDQHTVNQERELRQWAERAGREVVKVYTDEGISGAKARDQRPAFDAMLKDAVRRQFDVVAVWSVDRLGRSMLPLLDALQTIRETGAALYLHTQALDTTTPAGRAMFGMLGVFAEFERELIVARTLAGLARARAAGKVLGRPKVADDRERQARAMLKAGAGILKTAKALKLGTSTVQRIRGGMVGG